MDGMEMDYEYVYVVSIMRAWKATQSGHKIWQSSIENKQHV